MVAIYNNIFVVLNGQLLAESITIETALEKSTTPIYSIADNFIGTSVGPMMRTITVMNVIPLDGTEVHFEKILHNHWPVEILLKEGVSGRSVISRGVLTSVSRKAGVGSNSSVSFSFVGTPSYFEA